MFPLGSDDVSNLRRGSGLTNTPFSILNGDKMAGCANAIQMVKYTQVFMYVYVLLTGLVTFFFFFFFIKRTT